MRCRPDRRAESTLGHQRPRGPWSFLCETMWSLTSRRAERTSGPEKFRWSVKKDFFNTIGAKRTFTKRRSQLSAKPGRRRSFDNQSFRMDLASCEPHEPTICCSLAAPTTRAEAISGVAENCSAAVRRSTPCRPATSRSFSRFSIIGCGILPTGDRNEGKPDLATDASRDLVVSGISACLSLLRLKLSCLKFPEDRGSTSALSENTSTSRYLAPGDGYFGNVSGPDRVNHLIVQRECTSVCWASDC